MNWILTAAHCLYEGDDLEIVAGEHDFTVFTGTEQRISVVQRIIHADYDDWELLYDIAVMRIASPLMLVPGIVQVTRLPPEGRIHAGQVTLFGWGGTSRTAVQNWPDILQVNSVKQS